ncbi:glycoside hydrolase family 30 protein [Marinifilum caeruleilacunae]|uniref:Glycosyl hydrolase n=1 Tax=Marinifilum caeruleilacunae TaxID=2499076 RepID=A0ABX1WX75_9BACT|nr:glycoside hydrolase family 30 protein [Marinifilum caeruleilacunae]NOU60730.1 glycosyl hydrolase [Marinifilum caeruleilacunae]
MKRFIPLLAIPLAACIQPGEKTEPTKMKDMNVDGKKASIYTTAKDTDLRLDKSGTVEFKKAKQALETENSIFVNPNKTFQSFIGIGGAITDSSAEVFAKLSKEKQEELLQAYYGKNGIDYSLMRTSIHSCDFSKGKFTYIEEGDKELKTFSIDVDKEYRLPMIKRAIEKAGGSILFYASPWSPPAFMKDSKNMLQGGKLLPEYYDAWAKYYAKFIKAYEAEGIPVWGVTIQNEPMATQRWESCIYTAEEERDFLKNHLGPTFEKEGLADKKIVVWDHNRDLITHRANTIFDDPEAAKYAWGTGFHWYETWRKGKPMFDNLQRIQESYPDKKLLFTEGCNEAFDPEKYQYWPNAERYGRSMINDFNCGTVGWTDWNILLDETGGPNHVNNLCFAPVHADTRNDSLIYTPSYYYIGHFSKFIRPGAKRVSTVSSISFLESTTFVNPDGKMATVVMNSTDEEITYQLYVGSNTAASIVIPARAMQTIIY